MKTVSNLFIYKCLCNCSLVASYNTYNYVLNSTLLRCLIHFLPSRKFIKKKIKLINKHNIHLVYVSKENVAISMKISARFRLHDLQVNYLLRILKQNFADPSILNEHMSVKFL